MFFNIEDATFEISVNILNTHVKDNGITINTLV